jgi:anti-sigma B factor antagonist
MSISGRIDVYTASAVGESIQSLIAAGERTVTLDFSAVTAVDSSGLGTLVANAKSMAEAGGSMHLKGLSRRMRRALEVTHLAEYFMIEAEARSSDEALEVCTVGDGPSARGGK